MYLLIIIYVLIGLVVSTNNITFTLTVCVNLKTVKIHMNKSIVCLCQCKDHHNI